MLDDKILRYLETKVDALRQKDKDSDRRQTSDEVFDENALLAIYKLFTDGAIDTVEYPIATGKEANIYMATSKKGPLVVKIYRTSTATFKHLAKYILGDPRFRAVRPHHRDMINAWAQKEFRNLQRMRECAVRVPRPVQVHRNLLVMEYIGDEESPAPTLRTVRSKDPKKLFADVSANMKRIDKAGLVHGDLSEYNILIKGGRPYIIDVAQSVMLEHPLAQELFERDVRNIARYFRSLGLDVSEAMLVKKIRGE